MVNVGGRPRKWQTPEELQQVIDAYFAECDPHIDTHKVSIVAANGKGLAWRDEEYITEQKPYVITGLALALGTTRDTLLDYESGLYDDLFDPDTPEGNELRLRFSDTIKMAKLKCQMYAEQHLYTGKNPTGAIFNLKNNYGWKDKSEVDNNTNGEVIHKYEDMTDEQLAAALQARATSHNPEA